MDIFVGAAVKGASTEYIGINYLVRECTYTPEGNLKDEKLFRLQGTKKLSDSGLSEYEELGPQGYKGENNVYDNVYRKQEVYVKLVKDGKTTDLKKGYVIKNAAYTLYYPELIKAMGLSELKYKDDTGATKTIKSTDSNAPLKLGLIKNLGGWKLEWVDNPKTVRFDFEGLGGKSTTLSRWLTNIEKPYKDSDYVIDENGIRIAIKPHNSNDGYVKLGYGHAIQSDNDATKYGFTTGSKQNVSTVTAIISKQLESYKSYKDNPAILTFQEAETLLVNDLIKYQTQASKFANEIGAKFSQNEMDGITSLVYNGNRAYDPDSLLYYFLRKDKKGAINALHKAVDNGWYGSNEGLFRRRLMEFNIFFNNDYTFYDSNQMENLKIIVGY